MSDDDDLTPADEAALRSVKSVQPLDFERVAPPADLWSRIEAEAGAPSHIDVTSTPPTVKGAGRRRWLVVVGALAAAAVAAGALWLVARDDGGSEVAAVALSNEGLAEFPVTPHGKATLIREDGRYLLDVEVDDLSLQTEGYFEIWLIDRNVKGMVSLGPYHGHDRYDVPGAVDPSAYPVVDVSLEPADGTPTHSGVSAVRGLLPL